MSDENQDELSRRSVLKRAGAAGVAVGGLGVVGGTAAAESPSESVEEAATDVGGIVARLVAQVSTETRTECMPHPDCSCSENQYHDSSFGEASYVSAEQREVTLTKVPYLGIWVPTSMDDCGTCGRTGDLEECP